MSGPFPFRYSMHLPANWGAAKIAYFCGRLCKDLDPAEVAALFSNADSEGHGNGDLADYWVFVVRGLEDKVFHEDWIEAMNECKRVFV